MANRKVTVLNPAGYQEQLQSGDVAAFDSSNITLGTDKITLDASAGSASFSGKVDVIDSATPTVYTRLYDGSMLISNTTASGQGFGLYNTTQGAYTVAMDMDGTASFSGVVSTPDTGYFQANRSGGGTAYIGASADELIVVNDGASKNVVLNKNGSASFSGGLATIDKWGQLNVNTPTSTGYAFQSRILDGNATCIIEGSGDASFAGSIVANAASITTDIAAYKNVFLPSTAGNDGLYIGGTNSAANVIIKGSNGSASFSGEIDANGGLEAYIPTNNILSYSQRWFDDKYSTRGVVAVMGMGGSFWAKQSLNVGSDINNATVTINSDGSATFAGALEAASIDGGTY